jgi:predicted AlkP superfamily pyrophosphatase or phosphodiesterase
MKRTLTFLLALLCLTSCLPHARGLPAISTAAPSPTVPPIFTFTPTPFQPPTVPITPVVAQGPTATPVPRSTRVLIISIDGFRPDAIELTPMRNLQALMQEGAYSLVAQTIFPSATLPSHASMLTGMCSDKHGVTWNDYLPKRGYANGTDIFDLAHAARLRTVMVVGKEKLRQVTEPECTDVFEFINDREIVIAAHVAELIPQGFGLMFVHFPTPDWMGHEYGWLSPEQFSVLFRADEALQTILDALHAAGMRQDTLIIVKADHGGQDTTHGTHQLRT